MPSLRHPGSAPAFTASLRAPIALLYGAVICASGVALLGVTQFLAPGCSSAGAQSRGAGSAGRRHGPAPNPSPHQRRPVGAREHRGRVRDHGRVLARGRLAVAGRFVRPLRAIITAARDISASNLHRQLGVRGRGDEFTELGQTLDDLFGRLEASFQAQRRFNANASHELRTPLTAGRALLQVALADPEPTVETLRATCEELVALRRSSRSA